MKINWKETTLGEVAEKMFSGGTPPTQRSDFYGGDIPWLRTQEVNFNYIYNTEIKITEKGMKNSSARWASENTVVIAMYGNSAGRTAFSRIKTTTNQACCNFIADTKKADPLFIYFYLKNKYLELEGLANGGAQQNLSVSILKTFPLTIPIIEEQKEIAGVLGSLDDKIELLREENNTLEATAQAIFKEWFVNFNFPNAKGKPYKSSGGKMIDSEIREIPEGWRVGKLGEVIEIFDQKRIPLASDVRAGRKGKYPYYGATSIMDYIDDYLFDGTYLLLAEDGSVMDEGGYPVLQYVWGQFWVSNHAHVLQGKNGFSTEMLHILLRKTSVAGIVNGAVQLKINQKNLLNFEILIPLQDILGQFNAVLVPLYEKMKNISDQIQTLSTLRDTLLSKLMNGEIRTNPF